MEINNINDAPTNGFFGLPMSERPREKALKYGINYCSNAELLAIILGFGTRNNNVLKIAQNIIKSVDNLSELQSFSVKRFCEFEGIKKSKALQLQAAILLGVRIVTSSEKCLTKGSYNANLAYQKFKPLLLDNFQEKAVLIFINQAGNILGIKEFTGTTFNINMDFNTIKCLFYEYLPKKLLIMHSHINGPVNPSNEDVKLTLIIEKLCKENGILLLDHLIVSNNNYFSFKEEKLVNN